MIFPGAAIVVEKKVDETTNIAGSEATRLWGDDNGKIGYGSEMQERELNL